MCFMKEGKSDQAARCIKSRIMTKVIYSVLSNWFIWTKFVVLKGMLKLPRLKDHVHTIGVHPSLIKNTLYEHKCLEHIKRWYKQAGECDDQQQFKDIIEADMVSTPEGFTEKILYLSVHQHQSINQVLKLTVYIY